MALYFYFNETTRDLVYSDKSSYSGSGYTSLGRQTDTNPKDLSDWVFYSQRQKMRTVTKDPNISKRIDILTSMNSMFMNCILLTTLDLSGFDTSNVTDMYQMFDYAYAITSLDLSSFDTSNVTNMDFMFDGCSALTSLNLSGFDTSNVTTMTSMFYNCPALTSLDLSGFDTSNVTNMGNMFCSCSSLISLDLSGLDTSNVTIANEMFGDCPALRIIDISLNMSNVLSQLPAATYYDAFTRQAYAKADIPGGSTYVRDLADLDLVSTMVQDRAAIKAAEHELMAVVNNLAKEIAALKAGA